MKKTAWTWKALVIGAMLGSGCGGWKASAAATLAATHEAAKAASSIGEPFFDERCSSKAVACKETKDQACEPLKKCAEEFKEFNKAVKSVHSLVAATHMLIALDLKNEALWSVAKAAAALKIVYELARRYGVF